jgi:ubiquinone biosynthesis protein
LTVINQIKHIKRYRQIIRVFIKHGFGTIVDNLGILSYLKIKRHLLKGENSYDKKLNIGERLRLALEELGPTFVKLGQILSTRQDILPRYIIRELEKLQDEVPPFPFQEVKSIIESELNDNLENIFAEFDEEPIAAASIAQVHVARLKSGMKVVVKVQRPGIERIIDQDLSILEDLAQFIDKHTKYGRLYNFSKMIEEFKNTLFNELDFTVEGENADTFKKNFRRDKNIKVPEINWIYTTRRVLTMEYIEGIRLRDFYAFEEEGIDRKIIARNLSKSIFNQIFRDGFFHADPHPGNIMILPKNNIALLDFGMVGKLNEDRKIQFLKIFLGISFRDSKLIIRAIMSLGAMTQRVNIKKIERDLNSIRDTYLSIPLNDIKIGNIFRDIFELAFSYNIILPAEFTMLAKSLVTLEGAVAELDPEMNIFEVAEPIARRLMFKLYSPEKFMKGFLAGMVDYGNLLKEVPSSMLNFINKMEEEDYTLQFSLKGNEDTIKRIDKIANRISFSLVLLAVSIIIAGIIIGSGMSAHTGVEIYLLNLAVLKIGLVVGGLIVIWLVLSIFRSGSL